MRNSVEMAENEELVLHARHHFSSIDDAGPLVDGDRLAGRREVEEIPEHLVLGVALVDHDQRQHASTLRVPSVA